MNKTQLKKSLGIAALCFASLVGLKDTGILLSDHNTTLASGKSLSFEAEEQVEIIGEKEGIFTVKKGPAQVSIPKNKLIKIEGQDKLLIAKKNTPIKSNGKVLRTLFLGEQVTLEKEEKYAYLIKTKDNVTGLVDRNAMEVAGSANFITKGISKVNASLKNEGKTLKINKGKEVSIVSFKKGNFILIDEKGQNFSVPAGKIQIDGKDPILNASYPDKKEEKVEAKQAPAQASSAPAPVNGGKAGKVLSSLYSKMGATYVYGDTGKAGYDCSGLVYAIYKNELNINVPRTSSALSQFGQQVEKGQLQAGDLVFFATTGTGNVSHVGIYIGNGDFIHAASGQGKVVKNNLSQSYYTKNFVNATRVL